MLLNLLKILSLLFIFNSFSSAEYMYYEYCVDDYYFQDGYFYYKKSGEDSYTSSSSFYKYRFDDGYIYDSENNICVKKPILEELQIDNNTYYMLLGLVGIFVGFIFLFFGVYIAVDIAKK